MSTKPHTSNERAFAHATDAFMALSEIYLDSVERLSSSTLAVARAGLEDVAAATKTASAMNGSADPASFPAVLTQSLLERALAYTRDSYETVAKAQLEAAQVIQRQFSASAMYLPVAEDWKGAIEMFSRGLRELSTGAAASFEDARYAAGMSREGAAPKYHKAA